MTTITDKRSWKRYTPSAEQPWNERRVIHLHRRAAFRESPATIQRDLADGHERAVSRLLFPMFDSSSTEAFEAVADAIARSATNSFEVQKASTIVDHTSIGNGSKLQGWWFYRMMLSPDPLGERLTLMWHNHFATSLLKVRDAGLMRSQNELFRQLARAPFKKMLFSVVRHPAMLIWLDASVNRRGRPNENLARELMELFTLGIGNYTEDDVKEVARSLTGWTYRGDRLFDKESFHDRGTKTVLEKTGRWRGDDVLQILLDHPATPRRLAWRLCREFLNEATTTENAINELAAGLRANDLNIGWAVETILRSDLFFSEQNIGSRVASPIELMVGAVRSFSMLAPTPSTGQLAKWAGRMGQELFFPLNVGGWRGGLDWIAPHYMIARANFAHLLLHGRLHRDRDKKAMAKVRANLPTALRAQLAALNQYLFCNGIDDSDLDRIARIARREAKTVEGELPVAAAMLFRLPQAHFA